MRIKCLFKVKTKCTLYYDGEEGDWTDENPRMWNNPCGETLRKGSVLYVNYYDKYDILSDRVVLYTKKSKGGIVFNNGNEVKAMKEWFEVVNE